MAVAMKAFDAYAFGPDAFSVDWFDPVQTCTEQWVRGRTDTVLWTEKTKTISTDIRAFDEGAFDPDLFSIDWPLETWVTNHDC